MAKVKFDHAVIYNGVLYPANTEIETKEPKKTKEPKTEPKKETVKNDDKRTSGNAKTRNTD